LRCFYTNANSIINKMFEFRERVNTGSYEVAGAAETWSNESINDAELHIEGYNMYRKDRKRTRGGGLILYIKNTIRAAINEELTNCEFEESLWCNVELNGQRLLVGLCYRSPTSTPVNDENLLTVMEKAVLQTKAQHILIMGDFNYPEIDYAHETVATRHTDQPTLFFNKTQELCLYQHVTDVTRIRQNHTSHMLDYVFTDQENLIESVNCEVPLGKSDHVVLTWELLLATPPIESKQEKFNYHKGDYVKISNHLQTINWKERWEGRTVSEIWTDFTKTLRELVTLHVPRKTEGKRKVKRLSKQIRRKIKKRSQAWQKYCQYRSGRNFKKYQQLRNEVNRAIREEEDRNRKQILSGFKNNQKKFFGYMRSKQTVKDNLTALRKANGELTTTDLETAELLSAYFKEVYTVEDMTNLPMVTEKDLKWSDADLAFGETEVMEKLQKLKTDKSPGPDDIHPLLLKECASVLAEPLSLIFQQSFDTGILPTDWKTANIVPIFKKGNRTDKSNYRPVSLTSVPSKIMESIIKEKFMKFLESNNLLCRSQHGFRSGRSCLTNLLETLENWTKALDEGYGLDVVFLDYKKAFDSVPHRRLIDKLRSFGVNGKLLKWLDSFLTSRTMKVGLRGAFSQLLDVLSGVPQGSVLGPLLFLLYVNELPDWIKSELKMFADDTKVWHRIKKDTDSIALQDDLDRLQSWSDTWQLKFNAEKCKVMHMGHYFATKYYMGEGSIRKELESVQQERDLGVITTSDLKSSSQCLKSAATARKVIGMVRRTFRNLDVSDFRLIYKTYIRPHLEFCIQAWSPHFVKDIQVLENVQKAATNLVPKLRKYSYPDRLKMIGITSLKERRVRGDMIEVYKLLTGKEHIEYEQFFTLAQPHYGLRGHEKKLAKDRSRLDTRKHFFSQRVVNVWNSLPAEVVNAGSVNSFKNAYDRLCCKDMDDFS